MNLNDLLTTLEVYAHLRDLPQYADLRIAIEKQLKEANEAARPPTPISIPAKAEGDEKPNRRIA